MQSIGEAAVHVYVSVIKYVRELCFQIHQDSLLLSSNGILQESFLKYTLDNCQPTFIHKFHSQRTRIQRTKYQRHLYGSRMAISFDINYSVIPLLRKQNFWYYSTFLYILHLWNIRRIWYIILFCVWIHWKKHPLAFGFIIVYRQRCVLSAMKLPNKIAKPFRIKNIRNSLFRNIASENDPSTEIVSKTITALLPFKISSDINL